MEIVANGFKLEKPHKANSLRLVPSELLLFTDCTSSKDNNNIYK